MGTSLLKKRRNMSHQQRPPKYTTSFIDSCAFDPADSMEKESSRRLLDEAILEVAHSVQKEIDHPNTPSDVKSIARHLIFTIENPLTKDELNRREDVRLLVRGNAKVGQHENDADHLFELSKQGGGYFITTDNRLLSLSNELFKRYFITTIKPSDYEKLFKTST
jgi:hypothetical protein